MLVEGHYKLPFLSWLPHGLADVYMKLAGRKARYDVLLLSYRNLKKLVSSFQVVDYSIDIVKRPEHYAEGLEGMDLVDVIEMVCDWRAAAKARGVEVDLEHAVKRFHLAPQLESIIRNTLERWVK